MRASLVALASVLAGTAAGQNPPQTPVFGTGITLIEVEVSVLDRNRRPVRGLTAGDFTVFEEGAPQKVQTFAAIELPPPPATAWMRDVAPDVSGNQPRQGRLVAIVLDDVQITQRMVKPAKAMARRLIAELSPGDLAAVVFARDNSRSQEFTEDHARLLAAVESLRSGIITGVIGPPPQPPGGPGAAAAVYIPVPDSGDSSAGLSQRSSVDVLKKVAASVGGTPKRRKAIFYVSPGVPLDPSGRSATASNVRESLADVVREAKRWNVTIYPLDPGLQQLSVLPTLRREFLQTVADESGGFLIGERDDLAARVSQIFEETGAYYLLGYQSPQTEADGKFRAIEVKVARADVMVHARGGYQAPRPESASKPGASEVVQAIAESLPKPDIRMQAFAAPFASAGRSKPTLALVVGVRQPAAGNGSRVKESLQLQVRAFAPEGKLKAAQRLTYGFGLRAGGSEVAYELLSQLDLPPGTYQLRISARSEAHGKTGSVYYDVEVPDFSKRALSLSGLLLAARPAPVSVGQERLAALLPVSPTSMREFEKETNVTAFARVYQHARSAAAVPMVLTIVNGLNATVFKASESLHAAAFANGAADYSRELPLSGLEPGQYLLTVLARLDERTTAGRSVRFTILP